MAIIFNPHDVEDIAEKLTTIWCQATLGPDAESEERARQELPSRIREYVHSFVSAVKSLYIIWGTQYIIPNYIRLCN